jgi:hypothetical protein
MGEKEYVLFKTSEEDPPQHEEIEVVLTEKDTMEKFTAKVMLSSADNDFPDGNRLWVQEKDVIMIQEDRPWRVRILERETEEAGEVETKQKQLSLSERRGFMLKSMIEERGKKDS